MLDKRMVTYIGKLKGNINVDKLQGILLMDTYGNFVNKLLFGISLMHSVETKNGSLDELGNNQKLH